MTLTKRSAIVGLLLLLMASTAVDAQTSRAGHAQDHYRRAQDALRANHLDQATKEFRAILELDPRNAEAYANLGVIAFKQGMYAQAKDAFSKALTLKPALYDAKAFLGMSELRMGETAKGESLILEAFPNISNQAVRIDAGVAIVTLHEESRTLNQVVNVIHELQRLAPHNPEVLYVAYRAYSELAAEALGSLSQDGNFARVHQILAQAAVAQDDFPGAIKEYTLAIGADPSIPGIHYELGRTILTNSQDEAALDQAKREFETELAANPTDAGSEYELGEVFRLSRRTTDAETCYRRALELQPNFAPAHIGLGNLLSMEGNKPEALAHYQEAVRESPDNEIAHYELARALRSAGRIEDANVEMKLFLKLKQAHASANRIVDAPGDGKAQ
jgi:tetratricopeptide (TPR) repeat protein